MAVGLEKRCNGDKLREWQWFHPGDGWMVFKRPVYHTDGDLLLSVPIALGNTLKESVGKPQQCILMPKMG